MFNPKRDTPLDGLEGIEDVMRELRPSLPEDRVELLAARARNAARRGPSRSRSRKDSFVRSRLAITLMLVFGFALSGTGAGLAVSGIAGDGVASDAQYGTDAPPPTLAPPVTPPAPVPTPDSGVAGEEVEVPAQPEQQPDNDVAAEQEESPDAPADEVQVNRQLGADAEEGGELPFTGFAAIPVLILGVFLLASGLVLRRGSRSES